jgi:hypothetical protein
MEEMIAKEFPKRCRGDTATKSRDRLVLALIALALLVATALYAVGQQVGGEPAAKTQAAGQPGPHDTPKAPHAQAKAKELPEQPEIPKAADIEKMIVEVYGNPWPPLLDIGPFEVPREDYDKILDFFRHPVRMDEIALKVDNQELGTIRVIFPYRRSVRFCWFDVSNDPCFSFSCAGMRYRTVEKFTKDQATALDAMIREIHERTR